MIRIIGLSYLLLCRYTATGFCPLPDIRHLTRIILQIGNIPESNAEINGQCYLLAALIRLLSTNPDSVSARYLTTVNGQLIVNICRSIAGRRTAGYVFARHEAGLEPFPPHVINHLLRENHVLPRYNAKNPGTLLHQGPGNTSLSADFILGVTGELGEDYACWKGRVGDRSTFRKGRDRFGRYRNPLAHEPVVEYGYHVSNPVPRVVVTESGRKICNTAGGDNWRETFSKAELQELIDTCIIMLKIAAQGSDIPDKYLEMSIHLFEIRCRLLSPEGIEGDPLSTSERQELRSDSEVENLIKMLDARVIQYGQGSEEQGGFQMKGGKGENLELVNEILNLKQLVAKQAKELALLKKSKVVNDDEEDVLAANSGKRKKGKEVIREGIGDHTPYNKKLKDRKEVKDSDKDIFTPVGGASSGVGEIDEFDKELHSLYEAKAPVSASKIQTITRLAMKHVKHYKNVVNSIERFIKTCNPEMKLAELYVIDAIVREAAKKLHEGGENIISRFEEKLEGLFPSLLHGPAKDKERIERTVGLWKKAGIFNMEGLEVIEKAYLTNEKPSPEDTVNMRLQQLQEMGFCDATEKRDVSAEEKESCLICLLDLIARGETSKEEPAFLINLGDVSAAIVLRVVEEYLKGGRAEGLWILLGREAQKDVGMDGMEKQAYVSGPCGAGGDTKVGKEDGAARDAGFAC
ncbi:SR- and CTD-associated factor 8 [Rhizophlyctis rosea]|uniref:SR- and CTD-associated factor 8 n=1 Tax=Rhizophlyctis rosea TaxID=64517 RepID=A0AAD5SKV3_9FUNG|nr:SR- and CTD-associated factor 8 [Rhizophlyctis rosea]